MSTMPISKGELVPLRRILDDLEYGESVTLVDEAKKPVAIIVSLEEAAKSRSMTPSEWSVAWDELTEKVSQKWESEKSAVEIVSATMSVVIDASVFVSATKKDESQHPANREFLEVIRSSEEPRSSPTLVLAETSAAITRATGDVSLAGEIVVGIERFHASISFP